ncbi:putative uncharacterized protein DDB_G0271606 [Eupeodes corollae]|uniref:putative uncharacterized protein DDB_G0271606 n=1 Tax=Eupeodes corollae TaxID=290404 RepID=UPI0024938498|nr:putative uncharacterized protein DDB_G0271606 [Eupeodes corollae]
MVLCKFFMNGNCRFGTKCVNEHLDVKQLLKSDVESAVNGNQWPLSCFGPFKEKPSIPNFIEDQSFEEIRMLCYASKKQNFFEAFNQQFSKEVLEAKNKMKMLLTLNKEVMDVVVNLYNSSEPPKGNNQAISANPFASAANNSQSSSNTNLFGSAPAAGNQNNVFGGGASFGASNNANSGGGIFGGAQKPLLGQSSFGGFGGQQQQQQQQGTGLFSSAQAQPQQTNAFGSNIFAQASQQTGVGGGSIFAQQQQQPQTQMTQAQPFGATANTSVFGQQSNAGGIFAQAAQQTQPQQQTIGGGNIFSQAAQPQQQQSTGFGLFSQASQQQQQQLQPPPAFGAQMTQQTPFGAAQPQQQGAFFGQTQQQQQQQQQQQNNMFNSQMQQQQQQQQQFTQQQQQQPTGLFGTAAAASPFAAQQPQQQANIFAQAAAGYPQQQQQYQIQPAMAGDKTYSKMENLTPEEIEAFKADSFELGKVPFSPPPRELVN